jgi:DNA processing protein
MSSEYGEVLSESERAARIQMSRVAEPGDPDACHLVREHSALALVERLRGGHLEQPKAQAWAARLSAADPGQILHAARRVSARFLVPGDAEWPSELVDLRVLESALGDRRAGEPFGLWVRGPLALADAVGTAVAVVGARASSDYGDHVSGSLAAGCVARGWTIVSGGAYGIDAAAHRGALAAEGSTVAVLASGIDRLYPAGHGGLLEQVAATGLLVSEAAPGCSPSRTRFLVRNRLIAALSRGTVVVEAALRSGSLNTARWARDLSRALMGVPGPVTSMMSAGVHEMLRQPEAVLVTDADEVIELVAPIGSASAPVKQGPVTDRDALDEVSRRLLEAVPKVAPAPAASVATRAGMTPSEALAALAVLHERGLVISVGGGWRLPPASPDAP